MHLWIRKNLSAKNRPTPPSEPEFVVVERLRLSFFKFKGASKEEGRPFPGPHLRFDEVETLTSLT